MFQGKPIRLKKEQLIGMSPNPSALVCDNNLITHKCPVQSDGSKLIQSSVKVLAKLNAQIVDTIADALVSETLLQEGLRN